jgi:hypothetical protein
MSNDMQDWFADDGPPVDEHGYALWDDNNDDFSYAERAELAEADDRARMCGPPTSDYQAGQADGAAARGAYWEEMATRAGAEEKTDEQGREWYADDPERRSFVEVTPEHQRDLDARQDTADDQGQQQEDDMVVGPLPEDRTSVGGVTGSFNTTDEDHSMDRLAGGVDRAAPPRDRAQAKTDQDTIEAYIARAEADYWSEDAYGANGKGADATFAQLEDASDHGY